MGRSDIEQTESSGDSLRKELEGKLTALENKLDPKIEGKVPIWALGLVTTIILAAAGWTFLSLSAQVSALSTKVNQLDRDVGITNQKLDDSHLHR